jgi:aspartate aminotransferase
MDFLPPFVAAYRRRRDLVVAAMKGIAGVTCTVPDGAFYVFPNCEALLRRKTPKGKVIATDLDLCMYFLEDAGVALVPGSAFELPGHFRISYAASDAALEEGMKRLQEACGKLG